MGRPTAKKAEPRPVGRPTKYDPRYCDEVIAFMAEGFSLTAFAGSIRVSRSTIQEWIEAHPDFSSAVKVGHAARTAQLESTLLRAPDGPTVTSRIFALKNAAPEEWREKQEIQHGGSVRVERVERVIVDPADTDR